MTTAIREIRTQEDMNQLWGGVVAKFEGLKWATWLADETDRLEKRHAQTMEKQTDPTGRKHPPLAASTINRKGHSRILFDTNRLYNSLVSPSAEFSIRYAIDEWPRAQLIYGTSAPYSPFLTTGTDRMPARPHVGITRQRFGFIAHRACVYALEQLI